MTKHGFTGEYLPKVALTFWADGDTGVGSGSVTFKANMQPLERLQKQVCLDSGRHKDDLSHFALIR